MQYGQPRSQICLQRRPKVTAKEFQNPPKINKIWPKVPQQVSLWIPGSRKGSGNGPSRSPCGSPDHQKGLKMDPPGPQNENPSTLSKSLEHLSGEGLPSPLPPPCRAVSNIILITFSLLEVPFVRKYAYIQRQIIKNTRVL